MQVVRFGSSARWWAMGAMTLGVLAVGLDVTVLSVALPTLAGALKASESDLQWFSSGYALALAAGMLPAGVLGDRFGRRRVMAAALVLFAAGSIACAYAPGALPFTLARMVLGLAGAAIVVMCLSVVTVLFDEKERPRAVGIWAAANFLALPVGPILGGWLLTHYWWGWVFLMNVPVALVALTAVLALVPESRAPERPALDPVGMLLASGGFAGITYGLIELGRNGWTHGPSLAALALGVAIVASFFVWEGRIARPLIDLSLFRRRAFTWGVIITALGGLGLIGLVFTMPQYSQGVEGLDPQGAGLQLLPVIAGLVLGAVPADRVAARLGAKLTVAAGLAIATAGLLVGSHTAVGSSALFVALWMGVVGFGMGAGFATAASAAISTVPQEMGGVASALIQALQKMGAPFGSAILGSVIVTAYTAHLDLGGVPAPAAAVVRQSVFAGVAVARQLHSAALLDSVRQAFVVGLDAALVVSAAVAALAAVLALAFLPGRRRAVQSEAVPAVA